MVTVAVALAHKQAGKPVSAMFLALLPIGMYAMCLFSNFEMQLYGDLRRTTVLSYFAIFGCM